MGAALALRVLHIADSHIGAGLPRRGIVRNSRVRYRGQDFVDCYHRVLARARECHADLVIHAGDVFDHPRPSQAQVAEACEPLLKLAQDGIPVVVVPGNHERSSLPACLWLSHPGVHLVSEPTTVRLSVRGTRVAIAAFPCIRRSAAELFAPTLQQTGWERAAADITILAVHQAFRGARCGPADYTFRGGEDVIDPDAIPAGIDYVAAGHIHRHQVLQGDRLDRPPIVYAGSPDRITFAEMEEPKGCVLVEFDGRRPVARFLEHDVRAMLNMPLDVSGHTSETLLLAVRAKIAGAPEGALVGLRLTGQTTRPSLRQLQLARRVGQWRPDLALHISWNSIEWVAEREVAAARSRTSRGAFEELDAPAEPVLRVSREAVGELPAACGTYALSREDGGLLYVGKAVNVRARVRTHLRAGAVSSAAWTSQIAGIEVRPAADELEALLVEAELVRRLKPPFNQQMRLWRRYCYICHTDRAHDQLGVCDEPRDDGVCYGPFRSRWQAREAIEALAAWLGLALCPDESPASGGLLTAHPGARLCRRYFARQCAGPCGDRVSVDGYARRLAARRAILLGEPPDEALLSEFPLPADERQQVILNGVISRSELLRRARLLQNGLIILPPAARGRRVLLITARGLHIERLDTAQTAERILGWWNERVGRAPPSSCIPRSIADSLGTAAGYLARSPACCFVPVEARHTLTAAQLEALSARETGGNAAPPLSSSGRGARTACSAVVDRPAETGIHE